LPSASGEPPELDQPCLVRMYFQTELRQPLSKCFQEQLSIRSVFKAQYHIVGISAR
jgi:hypothetical protein